MKIFFGWLLTALGCLTLLVLSHVVRLPAWLVHRVWLLRGLHLALLLGFLMSAIGSWFRWPLRMRRSLPTAAIEPFCCLQSKSDFDGDVVAMRLAAMIEQEAGTKRKSLELLSSTPAPSIDLKLGLAGLSVPMAWLTNVWRWVTAREVIPVRGIICDDGKAASIVVVLGGMQNRYPIMEGAIGMEIALGGIARALLERLAPVRLARRYASEMNFAAASRIYNGYLARAGTLAEVELGLARVEVANNRYQRAMKRLERIETNKLSSEMRTEACRVIAEAHLKCGDFAACAGRIEEGLETIPKSRAASDARRRGEDGQVAALTSQEASFYQVRALLYTAQDDYGKAAEEWARVVGAITNELQKQVHSPMGEIRGWFQLEDEVIATLGTSFLSPLVYNLCDAWLNRALCLRHLQGPESSAAQYESFWHAISGLRALNVMSDFFTQVLSARCYLAFAGYLENSEDGEMRKQAPRYLGEALRWGDTAAGTLLNQAAYRPGEFWVPYVLAGIHLIRFNCLWRMTNSRNPAQTAPAPEMTAAALAECTRNIEMIATIPDRFFQAESNYGRAALAAVQSDAGEAARFLSCAADNTQDDDRHYPDVAIRARADESFDPVRESDVFQQAIRIAHA